MKQEANSTGCPNMGTMHKQSWVPLEFLTKMRDICSKHSTLLQMLVLNPVSWILYQVFSLLIYFGVVKDKRLSSKFEKSIQHQRLIHHSIKRKTNWEMRRTLVSDPEITPTYDCGAVLLGAVIIFYLYRKKKFKLHEVSIESSIISASSKEGVTRNLLLLLAMSMEMYRIWHEASLVEMRENHYVVVFKELQMAGDVELNPGPYPPELLARLMNDFAELRPEYYSLGVHLKVPVYIIDEIESDRGDRLAKIFDHWLHNTQEDLWFEQLYTALQRMHKSDLATVVQQNYMKSTKVFSRNVTTEELTDWLHSYHNLPESACKIIKDESIIGSVFVKLTNEDIDSLGFNFGARKILLEVLNQIKEHQSAQEGTPKKIFFEEISPKPRISGHDYKPFLESVHYILATFNKNEFNAATTVITSPEEDLKGVTEYDNNVYLGMIKPHPVGLLTCGHGKDCEDIIKRAVPLFPNAKYLVAAGVCYAFDGKGCKMGDVLISNQIIDLGNYQIEDVESSGDHTTVKDQIKGIFCFNTTRVKKFEVTEEGRNAKYFVGIIVSASNVINDSHMKEKFRYCVEHNEVYGGVMEGGVLLRLQKDGIKMPNGEKKFVQVIVIKSVTDFADGKKTKEWQFIGAQAAFNYVKDQIVIQPVEDQNVQRKMLLKECEEVYQKVVQDQTSVNIYIARLNFLGLPRSGKSTTMKRLVGEIVDIATAKWTKELESTGVAERHQALICRKISQHFTFGWSKSDLSKETALLNYFMKQAVKAAAGEPNPIPSKSEKSTSISVDQKYIDGIQDVPSEETHPDVLNKEMQPDVPIEEPYPDVSSERPDVPEGEEILSIFQNAVANEKWDMLKYALDDTVYLINTDTGGQTAFLELMSRFILGPSLNLIFSRLTDSLEDVYKIYATNKKGDSTEEEDSTVKLEDTIFQALASITCMEVPHQPNIKSKDAAKEDEKFQQPSTTSKAMFVGTFRDKISPEQFLMRDQTLSKKIEQTEFFSKEIVEYSSEEHLILALNNESGGQEEVDKMRKIFEKCFKIFKKIPIPATWLMLSIYMRHTKQRTMSLQQCQKKAETLGIEPESLMAVLWFLHYRVGVLLYYPEVEELQNIIILDIQLVFDVTTQLIKQTFIYSKVGKYAADCFKEKAQFELDKIKETAMVNPVDSIPVKKLVCLLEHHKILAKLWDKKDTYFMPCILKSATEEELKDIKCSKDIAPLMIRYECGYMPLGIFSTLITALPSKKDDKMDYKWEYEGDLRKDKVMFLVGKDCDQVTLISHPTFMEVHLYRRKRCPKQTNKNICPVIRDTLANTLTEVHSCMKYCSSLEIEFGFHCPRHPEKEHLSVKKGTRLKCLKESEIMDFEEEKFAIWFPNEVSDKYTVPTNPPAICPSVFSKNLTAKELADWLHSHHNLPEEACKIIKDQSITGSVFVDLTKEAIDSLGFNFGARNILPKVLNQIKEHQPAQDGSHHRRLARSSSSEQLGRSYFASGRKRNSEQSDTSGGSKYPRREDSSSDTEADKSLKRHSEQRETSGFSKHPRIEDSTSDVAVDKITNLTAEELADWLHSHHKLPEDACKILKDQSINGSVFVDLTKEEINSLGFNFGACKTLLKVLNQIKEDQPAQGARVTELNSDHCWEICRQLVSVKHQWEDIAQALGFKDYEIKDIKRDRSLQEGDQLREVISFWLRWCPKDERGSKDIATLEALQEALNQTNNARVEVKISMKSAKQ